jgi:hypothetical protein
MKGAKRWSGPAGKPDGGVWSFSGRDQEIVGGCDFCSVEGDKEEGRE